jgi:hypothetical protein
MLYGEDLEDLDLVYGTVGADGITGVIKAADAAAQTTAQVIGIVTQAGVSGTRYPTVLGGLVKSPSWNWNLSLGRLLFLDALIPKLSQTPPAAGTGKWISSVAWIMEPDSVIFTPSPHFVTKAW